MPKWDPASGTHLFYTDAKQTERMGYMITFSQSWKSKGLPGTETALHFHTNTGSPNMVIEQEQTIDK